ncbi:MAG: thiamine pyrophosphate-dependent dehydrogenase E1 component subunit alpha [Dehalococcoidia bacterium]|nr:thiamine pyrophosphate-dependent dehydrogenase E1 component subunit alpha [Dehalococcoidia bacterium]
METDLYREMVLIRTLEDELQKLCLEGEAGDLHFSKGQEAIAVGACAALAPEDYIVAHHRTIAHAVAKGVPLYPLVAEILGKADGVCGGMAGEMHLQYPPARFMFSFQLVGTCIPVAAGLAWAVKHHKKEDAIVAVFHGDATSSNGQWHEGMTLAAVQRLPLLIICENNGLAGNVTAPYYLPTRNVAERAKGYGVTSMRVDGNKVDAVYNAVHNGAAWVKSEQRPLFIEFMTTRLSWHKQGQRDVRTPEEIAKLARRDPIVQEAARLRLQEGEVKSISLTVLAEVAAVINKVRWAPDPVMPALP